MTKICGVADKGGPGAWCELDAGHKGYHAAGSYIFGPYQLPKKKVKSTLEDRVKALEKRIKALEENVGPAIMATRKY